MPSLAWRERLRESQVHTGSRERVTRGSAEHLVKLDGGVFVMGSDSKETFPADGEGPARKVQISPFYISPYAVTNQEFREFTTASGYVTEAERAGWSFVFHLEARHLPAKESKRHPHIAWWRTVRGASWSRPEGRGSSTRQRMDQPVVHVSWNDASAYCAWTGYRLPTEAEWEFACRGGLESKLYPWGDQLTPGGTHRCNIWQGTFPHSDTGEDGFVGRAPVDAFAANGFGLRNMTGNVWEWVADRYSADWHLTATRIDPVGPPDGDARVIRGGSYLCHESYCNRYRNSARSANTPDSFTGNLGFRVARDC